MPKGECIHIRQCTPEGTQRLRVQDAAYPQAQRLIPSGYAAPEGTQRLRASAYISGNAHLPVLQLICYTLKVS